MCGYVKRNRPRRRTEYEDRGIDYRDGRKDKIRFGLIQPCRSLSPHIALCCSPRADLTFLEMGNHCTVGGREGGRGRWDVHNRSFHHRHQTECIQRSRERERRPPRPWGRRRRRRRMTRWLPWLLCRLVDDRTMKQSHERAGGQAGRRAAAGQM